jgi:4-amino-4-deoxy-L-arabinose transferase-like glycosyltransferase
MNRSGAVRLGILTATAVLVLLLATSGTVGVTWDEPIYSEAAERSANWLGLVVQGDLQQAFNATTFGISWGLVSEHPPLVRVVGGLGWALTRAVLSAPTTHRVGNMALAACSIGVLVAATGRRRGAMIGIFVGAAVLAMPRVFFHAHLAALDFVLAAVWMMATLTFERATRTPRWMSPLVIGLALGLAMLTKINAVLLLPFWLIWLLLYRRTWRGLLVYLGSLPVALVVLIAGWPWIWKDPVSGLRNWVEFFRVHFGIPQWFAGRLYVNTPWYLPFVIIAITVPVTLLLLAAIGVFGKPNWHGTRSGEQATTGDRRTASRILALPGSDWTGLHLLGLLTILLYYALPFTSIHDQDRLLLPAFFHLAVLSGDGFAVVVIWLTGMMVARRRTQETGISFFVSRILTIGLALLFLAPGILGIIRWHPFELSYYNELVGGARGAQRRGMETAYFAGTYGHFLPELNRLPAGSKVWVVPNSWDVLYYYQRTGLLRDDIVLLRPSGWGSFYDDTGVRNEVGGLESADYALIERRQTSFNDSIPENAVQLEWAANKPIVALLERDGVVLAALYSK